MSRIILSNSIFQMHFIYCPRFKVSMSDKTLSLIQRLFSCNLHNYIEKKIIWKAQLQGVQQ